MRQKQTVAKRCHQMPAKLNRAIPFHRKPLTHLIGSILVAQAFALPTPTHAAPTAGTIVGGTGTITQSGLSTTIHQNTNRLAVDWQSFSINTNEKVNFLQPGTSSIALNRVLGSDPSNIFGQLNANGHVILANPNGVFFGPTASINVGGLIAAGMTLDPQAFMNGQFTLSTLEGTEGKVVNSGIINASTGGSVSLIGKQVKNEGLIVANLGTVSLQSGHEAIVTFDNQGILGIKVTKEVLQTELGVDPAVLNEGTIQAASGRILLTASKSRDLFTQAVNTGDIKQAKTAILNDDGTFTLSAGGNIENQGTLNVSGTTAGQITALGENITTSGHILANTEQGTAGTIELTSRDTTLLTRNSLTSANSDQGNAGQILILGNKVGIFDQSTVTANGNTQGGTVLLGGDQQGNNPYIPNADFLYTGQNTTVNADATNQGNGGKVIAFASDTARIYVTLTARGGQAGGDGGFVETSGKRGFDIQNTPDVSAPNGRGGEWLIDPNNISIVAGGGNTNINTATPFVSTNDSAQLGVDLILNALARNAEVTITTGTGGADGQDGNISLETNLLWDSDRSAATPVRDSTLTLSARNNISTNGFNISASDNVSGQTLIHRQLNLVLNADSDNNGAGSVDLGSSQITTNGGRFESTAVGFVSSAATISTTGATNIDGGAIDITATTGSIQAGFLTSNGGSADRNGGDGVVGRAGGDIVLTANNGSVSVGGAISSFGTAGDYRNARGGQDGGAGGSVEVWAGGLVSVGAIDVHGGAASGDIGYSVDAANGGVGGSVVLNGTSTVLGGAVDAHGGVGIGAARTGGAGGTVTTSANVTELGGDFDVRGGAQNDGASAGLDGTVTVDITGTDGGVTIGRIADFTSSAAINANTSTGTQTLTGADRINNWVVNGTGSGGLNGNNVTFTGIENLTGGSGNDTFTLGQGGSITGTINGGGSANTLQRTNTTGTNAWVLNGANQGTLNGGGFLNIQTLQGSASDTATDTLTGRDQPNTWTINSSGGGTVAETTTNPVDTVTFSGMDNLNGGTGDDTFTFGVNGNITGAIDAGAHVLGDVVDLSELGVVNVTLGAAPHGVQNAETIRGNNTNSTLNGGTGGYNWTITGENDGTVGGVINFENFNNLVGGTGNDSFTFGNATTSRITGYIDGGTGTDSFDISVLTQSASVGIGNSGLGTTANVRNMEQIFANGANANVLYGDNQTGTWTLTGTAAGAVAYGANSTAFSGFATLGGGNGTDTLVGSNGTNSWSITGANGGSVTGLTAFTGMENLTGGAGDDLFAFRSGSSISGIVNGGSGADDTVNLTALGSGITVQVGTGASFTTTANVRVSDIDNLIAIDSDASRNTLRGDDVDNTNWVLGGAHAGSVGGMAFSGFGTLLGGNRDDVFTFEANSTFGGSINAGGNDDVNFGGGDVVDLSLQARVDIRLGTDLSNGVNNAEVIRGNNVDSTVRGTDANTTWTLDATNRGSAVYGSQTVRFEGFNHLVGGTGNDTVNVTFNVPAGGGARITGGAGQDTLTLSGGGAGYSGTYSPNQLAYTVNGVTHSVAYDADVEQVTDNVVADHLTIPSVADNVFRGSHVDLNAGSFQLSRIDTGSTTAFTAVNYANKAGITVANGLGPDSVTLNGALNFTGTLALEVDQITPATGTSITASRLDINVRSGLGTDAQPLDINVGELALAATGAVYLREQTGLQITGLSTTGLFDLEAAGDITSTANLTASNGMNLNAAGGSISLAGSGNFFTGPIDLRAGGNAALINSGATTLSGVTARNLTLGSGGALTSTGPVVATGATQLAAAGAIALTDAGNDFNTLQVANATTVDIVDANGITLNGVSAQSRVSVAAGNDISAGSVNIANGTARLESRAGAINSGTISAGRVELQADGDIDLALRTSTLSAQTTNGNVHLSNTGAITLERLQAGNNITFETDTDINFMPGSVHANRDTGMLYMTSQSGSFLGVGSAVTNNPDITSRNATLMGPTGTFGTYGRPLVLDVPGTLFLQFLTKFKPIYYPAPPQEVIGGADLIDAFESLTRITGSQLTEVESLNEIDPAIFTPIRNYDHEQVAVRLPRDQLYDEPVEESNEDDRKKEKEHVNAETVPAAEAAQ